MNRYSVERRGPKYYLYNPAGHKVEGREAFPRERDKVAGLFAMAERLNRERV